MVREPAAGTLPISRMEKSATELDFEDGGLQRQPRSDPQLYRTSQHEWCDGHIFERQSQVAGNRFLSRSLPTRLLTTDQFREIGVDRRQMLEVTHLAISFQLRHVIRTELVDFCQRLRGPVRIEVNHRRKAAFRQPARFDGCVWLPENRSRSYDNVAARYGFPRLFHAYHLDSESGRVRRSKLLTRLAPNVVGEHLFQFEQLAQRVHIALALHSATENSQRLRLLARQILCSDCRRCSGSHRRDPYAIHHCRWNAGLRIIED